MKRITSSIFAVLFAFTAVCAIQAQTTAAATAGGSFKQEGIASWYGTEFDGRLTASGDIFDSTKFTAAHPTLPFGTIVTVTNTFNNKQVNVKINDRGPFVATRIIDLSRAAADALDMIITGTAQVIIEAPSVPANFMSEPAAPAATIAQAAPGPVQPVQTPAEQTPVQPVPGPVQQPEQPVQQVAAPVQPAPVQQTPVPVQQPEQPVQQAPAPVQPAPVQQAPVPVQPAPTPVQQAPVPVQQAPAPVQQTPVPVQQAPVPSVLLPEVPPVGTARAANIIGGIPAPGTGKFYRLQVGAYRVNKNAMDAFDKLKAVGLDPAYERLNDLYRVVLAKLKPEDIPSIAIKIYAAGFPEALIREER